MPVARCTMRFSQFYTVFAKSVCDDRYVFCICPARARRRRTWGDHTEADPLISYMVQNVKDFQGADFEAFERPFSIIGKPSLGSSGFEEVTSR